MSKSTDWQEEINNIGCRTREPHDHLVAGIIFGCEEGLDAREKKPMKTVKEIIALNNIISKIMYDYETHRGMPIDSIKKYQPDIESLIQSLIDASYKRGYEKGKNE